MIKKCCKITFAFTLNMFNSCCDNIIPSKGIDAKEIKDTINEGFYTDYEIEGITDKSGVEGYYFCKPKKITDLLKEERDKGYFFDFDTRYYYKHIYTKSSGLFGLSNTTVTEIYKIRRRCYEKKYNEEDIKKKLENRIVGKYMLNINKFFKDISAQSFTEKFYNFNDEIIKNFLEVVYNDSNKTVDFKVKDNISEEFLKKPAAKPATKPNINTNINTTTVVTTATTTTKEDSKKVEIKKNIILKKLVNEYLAPDTENEFKDLLNINDITKNDDISNKIFDCLSSKFNYIQKGGYELYSDKSGKAKLTEIKFESIKDNDVIYVKIKDFYLTNDQKVAVEELKNIELKDENNNIYSIYELINKINSNIDIIKNHQYCEKFINTYKDGTNGFIKKYNDIIVNLKSQCENTIKEINGIDETLEEEKIKNLKDKCKQNFKKAAGDYESKDIKTYTNLNSIINDYKSALESLDNKIKLFKEYKNYETGVENEVDKLLDIIGYKNVNDIDDFEKFKNEQQNKFSNITNNLDKKYVNYKSKFELFVNDLKRNFAGVINNKKNEIDKNNLKNAKSKEIYDEIVKALKEYEELYSNINNIDDKKLNNSEEVIKKEIKAKIDEILTEQLNSVDNNDDIKTEVSGKFKDENIKNNIDTILAIINNKKEKLKISFTLIKKNTENLKDDYSTKFDKIVNKYKKGVYKNVKFSELKSEISQGENDIKLFINEKEVEYNENITKDSIISVEFPDSYLIKVEIPKYTGKDDDPNNGNHDEENNDPNGKNKDKGEKNKNQEDVDNSNTKVDTTHKTKYSSKSKGNKTNTSCKKK